MLNHNETNSGAISTQDENSFSKNSLEQKIESLGKEIKSLRKQNRLNSGIIGLGVIGLVGYIIATNWATIAPALATAGTAIAAASPVIGIVIGAIVGAVVLACVSYAIWKHRAQIKEGFKYAADKTVEGAKYTAGKIKDGAVHAKDKVREGVDSLKKRFKERDRVVFYNYAKEGDAIEKMTKFPEEDRKKAGEIKHELKAIFADKENNAGLIQNILSGILSEIDLKMAEEAKSERREHTTKWQVQKDFIKHLGEKNLRVLIKQKALPSNVYFIDSVFSEHYDEIKEVIAKCKEDHILKGSLKMRSNMFEEGSARPSRSFSLLSFSSLRRKGSTQSTPESSRRSSVSTTDSTAGLLTGEHKEVETSTSLKDKLPAWLGGKKAREATNVEYQTLPESNIPPSVKIGNSTFYVSTPTPNENTGKTATIAGRPGVARRNSAGNLTKVTTPEAPTRSNSWPNLNGKSSFSEDVFNHPTVKQNLGSLSNGTLTRSNSVNSLASTDDTVSKSNSSSGRSFDSGFNSPNSSPTHVIFTEKDGNVKTQADLRKTGSLDTLVGQQAPSTAFVGPKATYTAVKTVG